MLYFFQKIKKFFVFDKQSSIDKKDENFLRASGDIHLEKIIIGKVMTIKKHPNADKLKIALTDIGADLPKQIICGGTNLRENMWVVVALPGAEVRWHGAGAPVVLEKVKIRGEESEGMICSANEIGLENMFPCLATEIIDLQGLNKLIPGQPLKEIVYKK